MRWTLLFFLVLAGCNIESKFQPVPDAYLLWTKQGATTVDVKKTLLECGFPSPSPSAYGPDVAHMNMNDKVLAKRCMRNAGFTYHDPFKSNSSLCNLYPDLPACQPGASIPKPSKERRLNSPYCKRKMSYEYCLKHAPYPENCIHNNYQKPPEECLP